MKNVPYRPSEDPFRFAEDLCSSKKRLRPPTADLGSPQKVLSPVQEVHRSQTEDLAGRAKVLFSVSEVLRWRSKDLLSKTKDLLLESKALRLELEELFVEPDGISWEAAGRSISPSSPLIHSSP